MKLTESILLEINQEVHKLKLIDSDIQHNWQRLKHKTTERMANNLQEEVEYLEQDYIEVLGRIVEIYKNIKVEDS